MYSLTDICSLCLERNLHFQSISSKDDEGVAVEEKLKVFLLELVNFKPTIQKYICDSCLENLNFIHKFRQKCLDNIDGLNKYVLELELRQSCENLPSNINYDDGDPLDINNDNLAVESIFIKKEAEYESDENLIEETSQTVSPEDVVKVEIEETQNNVEEKNIVENKTDTNTEDNDSTDDQPQNTNSEKRLKCPECDKTFSGPGHLKLHLRVHSTERTHKCSTCDKTFKDASDRKRHERTHTGEKPYICDVCNKAFTQHSHLHGHKRIHDNVRPYKCPVCNETFTQNGGLTRHMRRHTGEKPFHCHLCPYKCTTRSNLQIHIRTHTREKPYVCEFCQKSFVASNNLQRHRLRSHRDVVKSRVKD